MFIGCGSTTVWPEAQPAPSDLKVSLTFGLAVATLVQCVGHISGAHLNPAVTVAMLVTRNVTVLRASFYMLAQCIGGIAGAGILYGVTPVVVHGRLGVTMVHKEMGLGQAFGVEFMITFIVVFTVFANLEPKRIDMGSRSLAIGLSVALGHLFAVGTIGYIMNPCVYMVLPLTDLCVMGYIIYYTIYYTLNNKYIVRQSCPQRNNNNQGNQIITSISSALSNEMCF